MIEAIKKALEVTGGKVTDQIFGFIVKVTGKIPPASLEGKALISWIEEHKLTRPAKASGKPCSSTVTIDYTSSAEVCGTCDFTASALVNNSARIDLDDINFSEFWRSYSCCICEASESQQDDIDEDSYSYSGYRNQEYNNSETFTEGRNEVAKKLLDAPEFLSWLESKGVTWVPTVQELLNGDVGDWLDETEEAETEEET